MNKNTKQSARRNLIGLLFLCLSVRVIMPAGYMPAALADGGPFVLCPGSLSGASLILAAQAKASGHHAGHGNAHDHGADDETHFWEFCQFGGVLGAAAIDSDVALVFPEPAQNPIAAIPNVPLRSRTAHSFQARAPPLTKSRSV